MRPAAAARRRLFAAAPLIALGLALTSATPTRAPTIWTGAATGRWFLPGIWSAGVPTALTGAQIDSGTAVVGSPGAAANDLSIGVFGTGTLAIESGGTVSNGHGYVGLAAGSTGTVTVDGAGSTWTNFGSIVVGNS